VSVFTEAASAAKLLLTTCALEINLCILDKVVGIFALVFSNGMHVKEAWCALLVLPWLATSDVPAAVWTPLYFIVRDYKISIFEYLSADLGRDAHERSLVFARKELL
jgi:hypothetical protein